MLIMSNEASIKISHLCVINTGLEINVKEIMRPSIIKKGIPAHQVLKGEGLGTEQSVGWEIICISSFRFIMTRIYRNGEKKISKVKAFKPSRMVLREIIVYSRVV